MIYTELNQGVDDDIRKLNGQIKGVQTVLRTNLNPKLDYAISLINNVEQYFEDAPIEVKQRLLSLIFPEKVEFDGKSFRTKKINAVFELIDNETKQLRATKKGHTSRCVRLGSGGRIARCARDPLRKGFTNIRKAVSRADIVFSCHPPFCKQACNGRTT